jgi:hypothetical protein
MVPQGGTPSRRSGTSRARLESSLSQDPSFRAVQEADRSHGCSQAVCVRPPAFRCLRTRKQAATTEQCGTGFRPR